MDSEERGRDWALWVGVGVLGVLFFLIVTT
jgi:hypothetical protein